MSSPTGEFLGKFTFYLEKGNYNIPYGSGYLSPNPRDPKTPQDVLYIWAIGGNQYMDPLVHVSLIAAPRKDSYYLRLSNGWYVGKAPGGLVSVPLVEFKDAAAVEIPGYQPGSRSFKSTVTNNGYSMCMGRQEKNFNIAWWKSDVLTFQVEQVTPSWKEILQHGTTEVPNWPVDDRPGHKHWPTAKQDLTWVDLTGAKVTAASFPKVDFSHSNLTLVQFYGCDLRAKFEHATMVQADLRDSSLLGADLSNSDLTSAYLGDVSLNGAKLGNATLKGTGFTNCDLRIFCFDGIDFLDCDLERADLRGANLRGATLKNVKTMTGAKLNSAKLCGLDLSAVDLAHAHLVGADLSGAVLSGAHLEGADLTDATMEGTDFSNTDLASVKFSSRPLFYTTREPPTKSKPLTTFRGASLPVAILGLDWSRLDLEGAVLQGDIPADLTGLKAQYAVFPKRLDLTGRKATKAQFQNAKLNEVIFKKADLKDSKFNGANLDGADLSNARLDRARFDPDSQLRNPTSLRGAKLIGAALTCANLTGADLTAPPSQSGEHKPVPADLTGAYMANCKLDSAHLDGANLDRVKFFSDEEMECNHGEATARETTLNNASFVNAFLYKANFYNAAMNGVRMNGANLFMAKLKSAHLQPSSEGASDLNDTDLRGADFTDAALDQVEHDGAKIATDCGTASDLPTIEDPDGQRVTIDNYFDKTTNPPVASPKKSG